MNKSDAGGLEFCKDTRGAVVRECPDCIDAYFKLAEKYRDRVKVLELQVEELQNVIWSLYLFVGVYDGIMLDKERAQKLIRKHGRPPKPGVSVFAEKREGL